LGPMKARDIMTREVITVQTKTTLKELAKIFDEHRINGVPVVDEDGALLGIICESDLVRKNRKLHIPTVVSFVDAVFYLESSKKMEEEIKRITATEVGELYTRDVVTVETDTSVEEIAEIMTDRKIYTLPVMEGDRMVGIIGKGDVIKTLVI
jgi:CBS-domain-containing membrane protein